MRAASEAMAGAPRIWKRVTREPFALSQKETCAAHPHRFDSIIGVLYRVARVPLDLVGKQQLVDDLDAVVSYSERRHHLGRDGWRIWRGGLNGCHTGMIRHGERQCSATNDWVVKCLHS